MCTHDLYKAGLSDDFRLIRTCVRMIHIKAGVFRDLRLIRTYYVRIIHGRQDYLEILD